MDLLALADFNLVARYGGFGRAARAAGRPKATLSRRVAELEALARASGYAISSHRLDFYGLCPKCQAGKSEDPA